MKCSKPRFAFRPLVENLESRLQPGSMITGQGYGWSLLADQLSILNQGSADSPSLVSQSSFESSRPNQVSTPGVVHGDNLDIAVASVAAVRSTSLPSNNPVDGSLSTGLTSDDLSSPAAVTHSNPLLLAAVATPVQLPAPATPLGSVAQSPTGVAMPATPVQSTGSTPSPLLVAMTPLPAPAKVDGQITPLVNSLQSGPTFQISTHTLQSGLINTRSQPSWASFLGGAADDRLLAIALDPSISGATPNAQPIVAVGFSQSATDSTDVAGTVARISTDGTSASIATLDLGANTRTEIHSATVDPNDGSIYVNGQVTQNGATTDVIARVEVTPAFSTLDWALSHSNVTNESHGTSVMLDSTGMNLYATGDVDGNTYVSQLTNLTVQPTPSNGGVVNDVTINFNDANRNPAPSTGNGVAPDSQGNVDLAVQVQSSPDTYPVVAQVNSSFTALNWGGIFSHTSGPNATMNGVYVDSSDNVFVTGGVGVQSPPLDDELIAAFTSSGAQTGGVRITFTDNQGNFGQGIGYSIQTDSSGNIFTGITDTGPDPSLGGNIAFVKLDSGFSSIVEGPGSPGSGDGTASGINDDELRGLVLDPTHGALYIAGYTSSPDFSNPTGSFQPTYGGDPFDGVVVGYNVT